MDRQSTLTSSGRARGSDALDGARALVFRITGGPDRGLEGTISDGVAVLGRGAGASPRLSDPTVSQYHVELEARGGLIGVRDLGSHNGTFAGDIALERAWLPAPATLSIGGTTVLVECGEPVSRERSSAVGFGALVGASRPMREVYAALEKLARASLSVLIEGATGTGKELAARALHDEGPRATAPFVAVSCAALPPGLEDRLLFGAEEGVEDGAEARAGIFEAAGEGTVLLDHVSELSAELQAKILRALDQREVVRVGATSPRAFRARVVSTSQRSLRELVNRGAFREDLYFHLAHARVRMPPLDERPEDVKPLAQHFLSLMPRDGAGARAFADDALEALASRSFAGNARELRSAVERAAVLAEGTITARDLAFERFLAEAPGPAGVIEAASGAAEDAPIEPFKEAKRTVIDDFEKEYVARLLSRAGRNLSRAAALAGIERQSLRDLLKRHGLREADDER